MRELHRGEPIRAVRVLVGGDVDDFGEAGVRDRAVVALEVVLDRDLPVAPDLPVVPDAEAEAVDVEAARGNVAGQRAERVGQRAGVRVGVDEDERPPGLGRDREHGEALLVEVGLALRARRLAEGAVEVVRPRVVRALERLAVPVALRDQVPAVAADVDEAAQDALVVADDHDRDLAREAREEVAGLRDAVGPAGVLPGAREDALALQPLDRRVGVPVRRERRAGREGGAEIRLHPQILRRQVRSHLLEGGDEGVAVLEGSGRPTASIPPRGRAS